MISIDEAVDIALAHAARLEPVRLRLDEALDCVIAEDVRAAQPHPPFRASIKDGYAVRAGDVLSAGTELDVVGDSRAGCREPPRIEAGQACYVTTGAPVPAGADAVVEVERTTLTGADGGRRVCIQRVPRAGQDIRPVGHDIPREAVVIEANSRLGPAELGILATVGASEISVYPKPRVAVLSTGDEIVDHSTPAAQVPAGSVRDAVRPMIIAAVSDGRYARAVTDLGIVPDDADALRGAISRALESEADLLLTSGGVSAGDRDLLGAHVLGEFGEVLFTRVKMKPGKPLTCTHVPRPGGRGAMLIFSLPGNPVSSFATFSLVVAPCLRQLAGVRPARVRTLGVELAAPVALDPERPEYHRAWLSESAATDSASARWLAHSTGAAQQSSNMLSCRHADVLLQLPQGPGTLAEGAAVRAVLVRDLRASSAPALQREPLELRVLCAPASRHPAASAAQPPHGHVDSCARAARGALERAGWLVRVQTHTEPVPEPLGEAALARAPWSDVLGSHRPALVLVLAWPCVHIADNTLGGLSAALGERALCVPALGAALRRAAMGDGELAAISAQDATVVDRRTVVLLLDASAQTVGASLAAAAPVLGAFLGG